MRTLTNDSVQKLVSRWEKEAQEDIARINAGSLPESAKRKHRIDIMETFMRDRTEMELLAIRTELAIVKNPEAVRAEMGWADEDMKSDRCPEYLRDTFRTHVFECSALLSPSQEDRG